MTFDGLPEHLRRPDLRPLQTIPVEREGKKFVALRDPMMVSSQTLVVSPQVLPVLQQFRGRAELPEIAERINAQAESLVQLVESLDKVGLLWGPTFTRLEAEAKARLEAEGVFPRRTTASLGDDEGACRTAIESWLDQAEDPELEETVIGIVAPHLDYERGWPNYAAAYRCVDRDLAPDRVVVLGTNHFGLGDGVVLAELGFETPMGRCPADRTVVDRLVERLGDGLTVDQLDHLPEHSIELQVPWLQFLFGDVPLVAALVPDPISPMIAEDGKRVAHDDFVSALTEVLDEAGGTTFFVASSDLSHVGPFFGEPRAVDDQRRMDVERHDREMLGKYLDGDEEEFVAAMRWNKNPTRWCSIGNMSSALRVARPDVVELIDYRQACDERGQALVSSAAIALLREG